MIALLPIILLPVGAYALMSSTPIVYGTANVWIDQTSLQQLGYVVQGAPPATTLASYMGQLLFSPSFDAGVANRSPLYRRSLSIAPDPKIAAADDLGKNATAVFSGPNLVSVTYLSKNPAIAVQVVRGILDQTTYEITHLNHVQAGKDIAQYNRQLESARTRYKVAAQGLGQYMSQHGISSADLALRQLSDPTLATFYQAVQSAQTDETNIQQQLAQARAVQSSQAAFRVIDPPTAKLAPISKKKKLTSLLIPLVLGLLISGAFVVIRTALDRSLRYADEVPALLGLRVLATVPYSPVRVPPGSGGPVSTRRFALPLFRLKRHR